MNEFRTALSFLTVLPVGRSGERPALERAFPYFPVIGAGIGAAAGGLGAAAAEIWSPAVGAAAALAALAILTGGLHATADGWAAHPGAVRTPEGRSAVLTAMRDPRPGTAGVLALILVLGLQWTLLLELSLSAWMWSLAIVGSFSRLGMVLAAQGGRALTPDSGLGAEALNRKSFGRTAAAAAVAWGIAAGGVGLGPAAGILAASGLFAAACGRLFQRRFGGLTGDMLGAVNELTGLFLLLLLTRFF